MGDTGAVGADYINDLITQPRSSICDGMKRSEVKMVGGDYTMKCARHKKGKPAKFDKCQIKSPWGETFDVGPDLSGDGGRVVCNCKEGEPEKVDPRFGTYVCSAKVQQLEEKDNGNWSCILHYEKFGRKRTMTMNRNVLVAKKADEKRISP